ncbi:MAG: hypothetical protein AAAB35_25780 [Phyllobacterium sp.]|uniref:hypothetical protein n=1 Tax=Phyllobacterium sp. TaxID=1871046 RepID=UPI0030F109CE
MKTWTEKLNTDDQHEVKPAPISIAGMKAGEIMLVPTARQIDDFIRALPKGAEMDVRTMRRAMAKEHSAQVTCPITTGFHLRTVAEAAYEAYQRTGDAEAITPFWRVVNVRTPTITKLSFGAAFVLEQRRREGLSDA